MYVNSHEETLFFDQIPVVLTEFDSNVTINLKMQSTKTHKDVKYLRSSQRNCVFNNEMTFSHLVDDSYSFSSCLSDCRINQALNLCGCMPPFHKTKGMSNSTFCDLESLKCLKDPKILDLMKCQHCELPCDFTTFTIDNLQTA